MRVTTASLKRAFRLGLIAGIVATLGACGDTLPTTTHLTVPSYDVLAGQIAGGLDPVTSTSSDSVVDAGIIEMYLTVHYDFAPSEMMDLTEYIVGCIDVVCDIDVTILSGEGVVFDLIAVVDGQLSHRGIQVQDIIPEEANVVDLGLWPASQVYAGASSDAVIDAVVVRTDQAMFLTFGLAEGISDPLDPRPDSSLEGSIELDLSGAGFEDAITESEAFTVTHKIDLRGATRCGLPAYPSATTEVNPGCTAALSINGLDAAYAPYHFISNAFFVRIRYDLLGDVDFESILDNGNWRFSLATKDGSLATEAGFDEPLPLRP